MNLLGLLTFVEISIIFKICATWIKAYFVSCLKCSARCKTLEHLRRSGPGEKLGELDKRFQ